MRDHHRVFAQLEADLLDPARAREQGIRVAREVEEPNLEDKVAIGRKARYSEIDIEDPFSTHLRWKQPRHGGVTQCRISLAL